MKKPPVISVILCILLAIAFALFVEVGSIGAGTVNIGILDIDSDQYLSMAGDINGTAMPVAGKYANFESGWFVRVPGYPLLLSYLLPLREYGFTIAQVVIFAHFIPMLLSLIALCAVFRETNSLAGILFAYLAGSILMRVYFFAILAEWTAYSFLLVFLAALVLCRKTKRFVTYGAASVSASITTLVRPDYVFLLIVLPLAAFIFGERRGRAYAVMILGFLPIALLLAVNVYRFERLTLAPAEGHVIALTSLLVDDDFTSNAQGRCALTSEEIKRLNRAGSYDFLSLAAFDFEKIMRDGLGNGALVTDALRSRHPMEWPEVNSCALALSKEIVRQYPWRYVTAVFCSFLAVCWAVPVALAVRFSVKNGEKTSTTTTFFIAATVVHAVHVLMVSAVNIMYFRYYWPTAAAMACGAMLVLLERTAKESRDAKRISDH